MEKDALVQNKQRNGKLVPGMIETVKELAVIGMIIDVIVVEVIQKIEKFDGIEVRNGGVHEVEAKNAHVETGTEVPNELVAVTSDLLLFRLSLLVQQGGVC